MNWLSMEGSNWQTENWWLMLCMCWLKKDSYLNGPQVMIKKTHSSTSGFPSDKSAKKSSRGRNFYVQLWTAEGNNTPPYIISPTTSLLQQERPKCTEGIFRGHIAQSMVGWIKRSEENNSLWSCKIDTFNSTLRLVIEHYVTPTSCWARPILNWKMIRTTEHSRVNRLFKKEINAGPFRLTLFFALTWHSTWSFLHQHVYYYTVS